MGSKIKSTNSNMKFTLWEKYDRVKMAQILALENPEIISDELKGSLHKYKSKGHKGVVQVEYEKNEIGRLTTKVKKLKKGETCISQAYMDNIAKSGLCKDIYHDIDMVNCHFVLVEQLFDKYKLNCKLLKHFNKNREDVFQYMYNEHDLNRKQCKKIYVKLLYMESDKSKDSFDYKEVYELYKEIDTNKKIVCNDIKNNKYRTKAINEKVEDYYNINGTAFAYQIQTIECDLIMFVKNWFEERKYVIGALIHDGLHVEKIKDKPITKEMLEELSDDIYNETKWDIELVEKEFQTIEELDEITVCDNDEEAGQLFSDHIKNDYIECEGRTFIKDRDVWCEKNDRDTKRKLIQLMSTIEIKKKNDEDELIPYSKNQKGCNAILQFTYPSQDEDFVDDLWTSNIGVLCYKNGYYDLKNGILKPYDNNVKTTIKINRDFETAKPECKQVIWDKVLLPIFNNDLEMINCWLNYIARGLYGHIEDKNWAVGMGERNCGKGVLVSCLENTFKKYIVTTNSENFCYKDKTSGDSAKANSWMVNTEFARIVVTNEITMDSEGKIKINGNCIKKLSSGGDYIEARQNFKDEIQFKSQSRFMIFCNDLPPIEPSDCKETSYMFQFPSKFLDKDDERLNNPIKDKDGNIITAFFEKDDNIKSLLKEKDYINAFQEIILENYGNKIEIPESMKVDQEDFKEEETDEKRFLDMFLFASDGWDKKQDDNDDDDDNITPNRDYLFITEIKYMIQNSGISVSPQKYKKWLQKKGCVKDASHKEKNSNGKYGTVWRNLCKAKTDDDY